MSEKEKLLTAWSSLCNILTAETNVGRAPTPICDIRLDGFSNKWMDP